MKPLSINREKEAVCTMDKAALNLKDTMDLNLDRKLAINGAGGKCATFSTS